MGSLRRGLPWIALVALAAWTALGFQTQAAFPVGSQFPQLATTLADGSHMTLGEQGQQVVVLNFWASYCEPCRVEAPLLSQLQAQAGDVRVVGLSVEAGPPDVAATQARKLGMHFSIGVASDELVSQLRVQSVPTTYVIGKSGKIVMAHVGLLRSAELHKALAAARDAS
jgi:cytochrome c biogenesis protein CcmG/thiol:disulfide interchange protein DsbE